MYLGSHSTERENGKEEIFQKKKKIPKAMENITPQI